MADLIKYDMTDVWAVAGDVVAPDSAKIRAGWGVEVVPRQWWNWFENRQDNNIAYMLQKGFPEWDATTQYIINKSYVQRNGVVYRATATSTNSDPVALTSWVKAFPNSTAASEALSAVTPAANTMPYFTSASAADVTSLTAFGRSIAALVDAAAGRTLLSAQLTHSNLTALSGVTANTNILPYFTSTSAMAGTNLTAFARTLLDDVDAAAGRATLGLGTAATATMTTSVTDVTTGRVLKVGDFGIGNSASVVDWPGGDLNVVTGVGSGLYRAIGSTVNTPTGATGTVLYLVQNNSSATRQSQLYTDLVSGRIFSRTSNSGTVGAVSWSAWTEIWTTNNLVKTTSTADSTVGNMLKVGDFGFGTSGVRVGSIDGLPATGTGFYTLGTPYSGSPLAGQPVSVIHQAYDNERTQMAFYEGSTTVRVFVRKYRAAPTNAWGAWVELYHTGNSQALVDQVTAAVQPTLDAKVNKSGDVMTGQLGATSLYATGGFGVGGAVYLKAVGSTAPAGTDVSVIVDTPTASTNNAGRLVITAATTYLQSALTVTGVANFQGNINSSGTIQGATVTATGNVNGAGGVFGNNGVSVTGSGTLTVNGTANIAAGICRMNTGGFAVLPTSGVTGNASVYSFFALDGTTLRGAVYATSANQVVIQTGTAKSSVVCDSAGNTSMNNIAVTTVAATGRVSSNQDLLSATHVYLNNGSAYVDSTANPYGTVWGGYLSSFLANTYTQRGNIGADMAAVNVQGIGVYAFLQNTNSAMGIGALAAGGLYYSSHNNVSGTVAPGTWRCMGWANNGGCAVFQRIA